MTSIAETIHAARRQARMSQKQLAQACLLSERTIIRAEQGKPLSDEALRAIASVLNLDLAAMEPQADAVAPSSPQGLPSERQKVADTLAAYAAANIKGVRSLCMPDMGAWLAHWRAGSGREAVVEFGGGDPHAALIAGLRRYKSSRWIAVYAFAAVLAFMVLPGMLTGSDTVGAAFALLGTLLICPAVFLGLMPACRIDSLNAGLEKDIVRANEAYHTAYAVTDAALHVLVAREDGIRHQVYEAASARDWKAWDSGGTAHYRIDFGPYRVWVEHVRDEAMERFVARLPKCRATVVPYRPLGAAPAQAQGVAIA